MKKLCVVVIFLMGLISSTYGKEDKIKEPNVSGQFYSGEAEELASQIDHFMAAAAVSFPEKHAAMVIVPHAGYMYSGAVAADGFKAVSKEIYKTIVIIAPSHFFDFPGASLWQEGGFRTPLGVVRVDESFTKQLMALSPSFHFEPSVYEQEHALEVELPFLQKTFKDFKIVPILMGRPDLRVCQELSDALVQLIGDRKDVLIVVSSDMSHYHSDEAARGMDQETLSAIKELKANDFYSQNIFRTMEMCGFTGVTTALLYAKAKGLKPQVLKYANSGDVTGDKSRVVGYSAVAFYEGQDSLPKTEEKSSFSRAQKKRLLEIARQSIENRLVSRKLPELREADGRLFEKEGAFVTIHKYGNLRGCIGRVISDEPLYLTVRDMAVAAATQDPRFPPLSPQEIKDVELEVSVLSIPQEIKDVNQIQMGVHGVIVSRGSHQGLFLPQVATETGWDRERFLSVLCEQKAGLPADAWKDPATKIEIFTADVFSEKDI